MSFAIHDMAAASVINSNRVFFSLKVSKRVGQVSRYHSPVLGEEGVATTATQPTDPATTQPAVAVTAEAHSRVLARLEELCVTRTQPTAAAFNSAATYCAGYCSNPHLVVRVVWVLYIVLADNLRAVLHLDCGILAGNEVVTVHLSTNEGSRTGGLRQNKKTQGCGLHRWDWLHQQVWLQQRLLVFTE